MSNTWGISGPTFLALFLGLALIAFAVAIALRRAALAGLRRPLGLDESDPYLVAYLDGGGARAVQAAVVRLRLLGLLQPSAERGRWLPTETGPPSTAHEAGPFDAAVLDGVRAGHAMESLIRHEPVERELERLHRTAQERGALVPAEVRDRARRAVWPVAAVVALGAVRVPAGVANGRPVGLLVILVLAVAIAAVPLLRVPRVHPALARELDALRRRHTARPAVTGPELALAGALGIAVLGAAGLAGWGLLPPEEEEHLALAQPAAGTAGWSGWSSGGYSGGSSGGGFDGGGSGGGSDGGGSDGGGGGGCGGGGCGGCGG